MSNQINSKWSQEVGTWSHGANKYIDQKVVDLPDKILVMTVYEKTHGYVLKFNGGPTGFESYYIKDLVEGMKSFDDKVPFCICGGTINRWPRCEVQWADVAAFLKSKGFIK